MSVLLNSISVVTLAEIGDKTQLLSILLAARYRVFWPIFMGILLATLANHGLAAWFGQFLASFTSTDILYWVTSVLFVAIGLWILVPDKAPDVEQEKPSAYGPFLTSLVMFFIAEMGDKTQFATVTLGAQYSQLWLVTLGTTIGMMLANAPAVWFGDIVLQKVPLHYVRWAASLLFVALGSYGIWQLVA